MSIAPPTPPQPDIEMALSLLEGNATKIPPELALPLLPKDIPIHKIKHYLTVSFRDHLNKKRNSQILRGLIYAEHLQVRITVVENRKLQNLGSNDVLCWLQVQELRIRVESENTLITEQDICPVCKKRFGHQR